MDTDGDADRLLGKKQSALGRAKQGAVLKYLPSFKISEPTQAELELIHQEDLETEKLEQAERDWICRTEKNPSPVKTCSLKDHIRETVIVSGYLVKVRIIKWKNGAMIVKFGDETGHILVFVKNRKHQLKIRDLKTKNLTLIGFVLSARNILLTDIVPNSS